VSPIENPRVPSSILGWATMILYKKRQHALLAFFFAAGMWPMSSFWARGAVLKMDGSFCRRLRHD
jgi:hypothetical protein